MAANNENLSSGAITFHLPNKEKQAITFDIHIGIPKFGYLKDNGIVFKNMEVGQFDTKLNFDCIIGMDILRKGDMALTNAKGEMVFTFRIPPAETHIDFAKEEKQ